MTLDDLGPRICILGPSNAGKSTLAVAIARARGLPVVHLDQLHHRPHTDWQPRPLAEFVALHDAAIAAPHWIIDGNYSRCQPQRLARATGVIRLETSTLTSLVRYVRRTWFQRHRHGTLEGGGERLKWEMIHHITVVIPARRRHRAALFDALTIPGISLATRRELDAFYRIEGLSRT